MLVLIVGGLVTLASGIKQEVFPEVEMDMVSTQVTYPGASPAEVEQAVILAVEEAVRGVDGVKKVTSNAMEGSGTVNVELLLGADDEVEDWVCQGRDPSPKTAPMQEVAAFRSPPRRASSAASAANR